MKRILPILVALLAPAFAQSIPDELRIQQRLNDDSGYTMRTYGAPPAGNANYILGFDGSITRPVKFLLGQGVSWNGTDGLKVSNLPISATNGLQTAIDGKQAASPFLTELATIGTMSANEAIRTNNTGDFVAESRANYRAWLGITTSDVSGLATVASTGAYNDLSGRPSNLSDFTNGPGYITSSALSPYVTSSSLTTTLGSYATTSSLSIGLAGKQDSLGFTPYNATNPSGYVNQAGARSAISLTTTGTSGAATYNSSTGVLNVPQYADPARAFSTPTFSGITTAAQLSTTRDAEVSYDIDATVTISLLAGQSVTATLRYADNSGMSTNVVTVSSQTTSNGGVLNLTTTNTLKLSGWIPAGKYRQVTFSTTGTGTATPSAIKAGQEVLQ